jgi:hypothetical protein
VHRGACTLLPLALRQVAAVLAVSTLADLATLKQKGSIDGSRVSEAVAGNLVLQVVDHRLNSYPTLSRGADLQLLRAVAKVHKHVSDYMVVCCMLLHAYCGNAVALFRLCVYC